MNKLSIAKQRGYNQSSPELAVVAGVLPSQIKTKEKFNQFGGNSYFNTINHNYGIRKLESKCKPKKRKTLAEKLRIYYTTRMKLSKLYAELGNDRKSAKIRKCSSFFNVMTCGSHIVSRKASFLCKNRLCPECERKRSNRLFSEYEPIVNAFLASRPEITPLHLVLTQSQKQGEVIKDARKRLIKAIKRLIEREFWINSFAGSLNTYEFTISKRIYASGVIHYHAHLLVFCKLPDNKRNKEWLSEFRRVWLGVSKGENKNLKIIPVTDIRNGLKEVLGYCVKPQDIQEFSVNHLAQVEDLHRCKMLSTFGDFNEFAKEYREAQKQAKNKPQADYKPLAVGDACPICQKALYEIQKPIGQLIIIAQGMENQENYKE